VSPQPVTTFNGTGGGQILGGVMASHLAIKQMMA
jgi:hypothetical protein